jgi:hypothetical protein
MPFAVEIEHRRLTCGHDAPSLSLNLAIWASNGPDSDLRQPRMAHVAGAMRFPILFTGANKAMAALGLTAGNSSVEVGSETLRVRMGWAFSAEAPLASVRSAAEDHDSVWGWGAHGWRGVWLVNGSSQNLVRVDFDPPGRARTLGWPITLHALRVSVEDPAGLIAALNGRRSV